MQEQRKVVCAHNIVCIVERPDGSLYEQTVTVKQNETYDRAVARFQKMLGKEYQVVDYYDDGDI